MIHTEQKSSFRLRVSLFSDLGSSGSLAGVAGAQLSGFSDGGLVSCEPAVSRGASVTLAKLAGAAQHLLTLLATLSNTQQRNQDNKLVQDTGDIRKQHYLCYLIFQKKRYFNHQHIIKTSRLSDTLEMYSLRQVNLQTTQASTAGSRTVHTFKLVSFPPSLARQGFLF